VARVSAAVNGGAERTADAEGPALRQAGRLVAQRRRSQLRAQRQRPQWLLRAQQRLLKLRLSRLAVVLLPLDLDFLNGTRTVVELHIRLE